MFSVYPLRMTQKDCEKTIDSFLFEQDGKSHYSLTKYFSRLFRFKLLQEQMVRVYFAKNVLLALPRKNY